MFFNVSDINREINGTKTESDGGFAIKRLYVGIEHQFNKVLSGNITTDIDSVGAPNGSLVGKGLYLKKAYLQASSRRRSRCGPAPPTCRGCLTSKASMACATSRT